MNIWDRNGIIDALLWLIPAAAMFWTVRSNHRGTPTPVRLGMGRGMLVLSAAFLGGGIYAAWITPRRLHAGDYAALSLWFMQVVLWVWLCRYVGAKLRMERGEQVKRTRKGAGFFWQAIFILLPVVGLACFGIYSMRQDRLIAEQEARTMGQELAERLAQAIGRSSIQNGRLSRGLIDYYNASFELEATRQVVFGMSSFGYGPDADRIHREIIEAWEQANPESDLSLLPPPDGSLSRQPEETIPQPPTWLGQLNEEQRRLWQAAQSATGDYPAAQSAVQKFLESSPPAEARANAEYLLLLAKTHGDSGNEAAAQFLSSRWSGSGQLTDAGLQVGTLICWQGLRLMPDGTGVSDAVFKKIALVTSLGHSPFSPWLISEVERAAKGTASETNVATLRSWWEAHEKQRQILEDFRIQHPADTWTNVMAYRVNSSAGEYLIFLEGGNQAQTNSANGMSFQFQLFPLPVVKKALALAVSDADLPMPPYALVQFEMGGEKIVLSGDQSLEAENSALPVLGRTTGALSGIPWTSGSFLFQVHVLLASPEILYEREKQRMLLFGALIVASAFGALIALLAAYRSFRRQLALNEMKSDFVSSVSHELRAPIASVRLMAEGLERGKIQEPGKQHEYFKFIVQECRRLSSLIENVLDFSRIEEGRKRYEMESTDLVALTNQTVKVMATYAAERQVELTLQVSGKAAPVNADGKALQQALVNLIDNAIKHSPKAGAITVSLNFDDESLIARRVCLSVKDQGEGIPASEHEKIFERFYRVGSELRRETQGVGIGLSIVKHIVEAHGGKVTVQSAPGQGSVFTIELPVGRNGQEH